MKSPMKSLAKQGSFGVPSAEVIGMIEDSDKIEALQAAGYRFSASMRELETQFEAKASEIRGAYLCEVADINSVE
jgi:hypothetical protein